MVIYSCLPSLI
jgi:hypothetical protein